MLAAAAANINFTGGIVFHGGNILSPGMTVNMLHGHLGGTTGQNTYDFLLVFYRNSDRFCATVDFMPNWATVISKARYTLATTLNATRSTLLKVNKVDCGFGPVLTGNKVDRISNKVNRDKLSNSSCSRFVDKTGNKVERIRQQSTLLPVSAKVDFQQSRQC